MRDISKLHWITKVEKDKYEMILDHHMLSSWRMCQANFELLHIEGRRIKAGYSWSLEFGALLHKMIEHLYKWRLEGTWSLDKTTQEAYHLWDEKNMDRFREHRTCKSLGGKLGFIALTHMYASYYGQDTERIRIIDTEVSFGRNKEVPLGSFQTIVDKKLVTVYCYLSGRIDFLADDGLKIGPIDHKTRASFNSHDLGATYNPHEGMTGYIYATKKIIETHYPEQAKQRQVNTAWMNFIQVSHEVDPLKRFRRVLLMRTPYQLEEYRLRQIESFKDIFRYLQFSRKAQWNTEVCTHWYGNECVYRPVHRQPDEASQLIVLNNDYSVEEFWNPEKPEAENDGGAAVARVEEPVQST
jgi:hypothetical protein